jgi:hypothetical protein
VLNNTGSPSTQFSCTPAKSNVLFYVQVAILYDMVRNAKINSVNLFVLFSSKENIAQLLHDRYDSPRYASRIPAVSEVLISMITMEQQFKIKQQLNLTLLTNSLSEPVWPMP